MIKKSIILAVVVIILMVIVVSKKSSMKSQSQGSSKIFYSIKDKLTQVQITVNEDATELQKSDGQWFTKDANFPVDTARINKLLDVIFNLDNSEVVSRNPERASEYGIDSTKRKSLVLLDNNGGELGKVHIGKTSSADYNSTYWKLDGKDEVYRSAGNFSNQIYGKSMDWKDKKIFSFEGSEIQQLDVTWKDSVGEATTYSVAAKEGEEDQWTTVHPMKGGAKKSVVNSMANRFKQLSIDKFKEESDTTVLEDDFTYDIRVTLKSGDTHTIKALKGEKETYMKHPTRDEIILFSNWRFEVYEKAVSDFFEPDTGAAAPAPAGAPSPLGVAPPPSTL